MPRIGLLGITFLLLLSVSILNAGCAKRGATNTSQPKFGLGAPEENEGGTTFSLGRVDENESVFRTAASKADDSPSLSETQSGASTTSASKGSDPDALKTLLGMKPPRNLNKELQAGVQLRPLAMREAAQVVSVQSGFAWRYQRILDEVGKYSPTLDKGFNFSPILIKHDNALILPPIIAKSGAGMRIEEETTATSVATTYELLSPAKYVSVVPNWRTYLDAPKAPDVEPPHPALLPRTSEERRIWQEAVREGWLAGVEQANFLFEDNVARLTRDYKGAVLYHHLVAEGLLSKPSYAKAEANTRVTKNKMFLEQIVFRITQPAAFNTNTKEWRTTLK